METMTYVFQADSEEVNKVYLTEPNFLIKYPEGANGHSGNNIPFCVLYFSSNDIYYPNTPEAFKNQLVKKNRFEWFGTRVNYGQKHIFLRDLKKQWYLTGINGKINSIEKLEQFLRKETEGYQVITVGSSAGGFAAVLFGQLLNARCTFTFNGQFVLSELLEKTSESLNPIVFRERDNVLVNKYFNLRSFITRPEIIFYFYSAKSPSDAIQYRHISDMGINAIPFRTSHHGIPFLKSNLKYVLNYTIPELEKVSKKNQHPLLFSFKTEGPYGTITSLVRQTHKYLVRRLL
jgi:hypothetical protein